MQNEKKVDIEIIDNFLLDYQYEKVLEECNQLQYTYGQYDNQKELIPTGMVSELSNNLFTFQVLKNRIELKYPTLLLNNYGFASYVNLYSPGENSYFHTDNEEGDDWYTYGYTLLYYPTDKWDLGDGGETQFYDGDRVIGIPPLPNRLVKFKVPILHRATPFLNKHRFSVAFKYLSIMKK